MNQPSSHPAPAHADDEISLMELWQALRQRAVLIVASTVLSAGVAAAIAWNMTPIFRAEVVLAVVEEGSSGNSLSGLASQLGGLASLGGFGLGSSGTRTEALGTLTSRQLVETYITQQQLLPILFDKQWDENQKDWRADIEKKPTLWQGTQLFTKSVRKIAEDKKSGLVTLSVEWKDPALAARWANDLVRLVNQSLRERAIAKSEENLKYLNIQLEKASVVELRQAIYRLIESEVKNIMVAQGSADYAFSVIDPAVMPEKKIKPNRKMLVVVGAFLGLILSSFYVLVSGRKPHPVST